MKWWKIALILLSIGLLELTEAPIRKLWERVGPAGEEEKLARCVWVGDLFGIENVGRDWVVATSTAYAEAVDENCFEARQCVQRKSYWLQKVRGNGEGGFISHNKVREWGESEFCKNVVADYKSRQTVLPEEASESIASSEKQIPLENQPAASSDQKGSTNVDPGQVNLETGPTQSSGEQNDKAPSNAFAKKMMGDVIDNRPNAEPRNSSEMTNKINKREWQDKSGFLHYPDGSVSSGPVD